MHQTQSTAHSGRSRVVLVGMLLPLKHHARDGPIEEAAIQARVGRPLFLCRSRHDWRLAGRRLRTQSLGFWDGPRQLSGDLRQCDWGSTTYCNTPIGAIRTILSLRRTAVRVRLGLLLGLCISSGDLLGSSDFSTLWPVSGDERQTSIRCVGRCCCDPGSRSRRLLSDRDDLDHFRFDVAANREAEASDHDSSCVPGIQNGRPPCCPDYS